MTLRAALPWGITAVAAGVAVWAVADREEPARPTTVAIEAPPPDAPIPGPDLGPPAEPAPPALQTSEPPAPPVPTGLEVSRGSITMRELQDPATGERFFRVSNRDLSPAELQLPPADPPDLPAQVGEDGAPEGEEPEDAVADRGPDDREDLEALETALEPVEETAAPDEAAPLTEDDLRRIVREELQAHEQEREAEREEEVAAAREAAVSQFVADAGISPEETREMRSLLESEVGVLQDTRTALQQGRLTLSEAWSRVDRQRRKTERDLRKLLGDRGYALYHQQGIGEVITGMWTLHTNLYEPLSTWR